MLNITRTILKLPTISHAVSYVSPVLYNMNFGQTEDKAGWILFIYDGWRMSASTFYCEFLHSYCFMVMLRKKIGGAVDCYRINWMIL